MVKIDIIDEFKSAIMSKSTKEVITKLHYLHEIE